MHTLRQYLLTLSDPQGLLRTLDGAEACRDEAGRICYAVGNSAAVFRIRHEGRIRSLRCYLRPMRHLREIYGDRLLEREIFLYDAAGRGEWVDAVVGDWIEGTTLREAAGRAAAAGDTARLRALAAAFDRMVAPMVADDRAHGDLKPENIIVDPAGALHAIDFDAAFLPAFAGEPSPELGTAAYQHPARTAADFNDRIDDYPAALISTALHALALDPSLAARYAACDGLLFTPQCILRRNDAAYDEALALFERHGDALRYRVARMLASPTPALYGLTELLAFAVCEQAAAAERAGESEDCEIDKGIEAAGSDRKTEALPQSEPPELFVENGRWGFRTPQRVVVAPLYDNGFDFTEGLAAVLLGRTWHFIDTCGRVRLSCPECTSVKPFRHGRAQVVCHGRRMEIDRYGAVVDAPSDASGASGAEDSLSLEEFPARRGNP